MNAAEASARGAELEVTALIFDGLVASFAVGYLDAEFDDFDNALIKGNSTVVDLSGQALPLTPDVTLSASLEYNIPMGDSGFEGFVLGEWTYRSETLSNLEAIASDAGLLSLPDFPYQLDAYHVVNLRAGIESEKIRVNAFVENALDENYITGTGDGFGLAGIKVKTTPLRIWCEAHIYFLIASVRPCLADGLFDRLPFLYLVEAKMIRKRVLVTGCSGGLGAEIVRHESQRAAAMVDWSGVARWLNAH